MKSAILWAAILAMIGVGRLSAQTYAVDWFAIYPGGASSNAAYSVRGIIGQAEAQVMAGGGFGAAGGFLGGISILQQPGLPALAIARVGTNAVISWPAAFGGFVLQRKQSSLNSAESWTDAGLPIVLANGTNTVTVPLSGYAVYRLKR
jgi:hypothetical protein